MGARLQLRDTFSGPLRFILQNLTRASQETNQYRDANGRLRDEMGRFVRQARQTQDSLQHVGAEASRTHGRIVSLQGAIAAVASGMAVKAGFDWLVQGNAEMETYQNTLAVVLKDQQRAADTLKWAQTFAAQTPFEIPAVVEATTKLASYGMEAQKVLGITGDMASVMGKSLDQAVEAIADAQTGELERLKEFGITRAMIEAQGARMGADFINKSGQITDQQAFNAALFALMEDRYKGGMELQSKTFKGMLSNASDFIGTMGRQLGAPLFDKLKAGLGDTLGWIQRLKDSGQLDVWIQRVQYGAGVAWRVMSAAGGIIASVFKESFAVARQNVEMIAGKMRAWYDEHRPQMQKIGALFVEAFQALQTAWAAYAVPTIDWLRNTGLPGVVDALATVGGLIVDVAAWFIDNWGWVGPMLAGLAIAWGAVGIKILAVAAYQKAAALATKGWAAAQAALNFVMNMNPIGLIITGIGLLIGAVILLVTHWDFVKQKTVEVWQTVKGWIMGAPDWLLAIVAPVLLVVKHWDQIKETAGLVWEAAKAAFDKLKDKVAEFAQSVVDTWNRVKDFLKNPIDGVVNLIQHGSISPAAQENLPGHATGLHRVPFDGYQAQLHRDERVLTASEARRYDSALGFQQPAAQQQPRQVQIEKLVDKVEIHAAPGDDGEALYGKFIEVFYRKVKENAGILSTADMGALL